MAKTGIGMSSFVSKQELLLQLKGENYNFLETEVKRKKNSFLTRKKSIPMETLVVLNIILFLLGVGILANSNEKTYIITVMEKECIFDYHTHSSKYLVFGENKNGEALVFENADSFLRLKWNSSDIQTQLKEDNTYKITVVGYRIPSLSRYQNIIKAEKIIKK